MSTLHTFKLVQIYSHFFSSHLLQAYICHSLIYLFLIIHIYENLVYSLWQCLLFIHSPQTKLCKSNLLNHVPYINTLEFWKSNYFKLALSHPLPIEVAPRSRPHCKLVGQITTMSSSSSYYLSTITYIATVNPSFGFSKI